jgi:hypothetical protein
VPQVQSLRKNYNSAKLWPVKIKLPPQVRSKFKSRRKKKILFSFTCHCCRTYGHGSLCSTIAVRHNPSGVHQLLFDVCQYVYVEFYLSSPFHPPMSIRCYSSPSTRHILQIICTMYIRIRYHIFQTVCMYFLKSYIGFFKINMYIYIFSY